MLNAIVRNFNGGPVGLNNLAAMVGEESETVETVCEPYLVRGVYDSHAQRPCGYREGMAAFGDYAQR